MNKLSANQEWTYFSINPVMSQLSPKITKGIFNILIISCSWENKQTNKTENADIWPAILHQYGFFPKPNFYSDV